MQGTGYATKDEYPNRRVTPSYGLRRRTIKKHAIVVKTETSLTKESAALISLKNISGDKYVCEPSSAADTTAALDTHEQSCSWG